MLFFSSPILSARPWCAEKAGHRLRLPTGPQRARRTSRDDRHLGRSAPSPTSAASISMWNHLGARRKTVDPAGERGHRSGSPAAISRSHSVTGEVGRRPRAVHRPANAQARGCVRREEPFAIKGCGDRQLKSVQPAPHRFVGPELIAPPPTYNNGSPGVSDGAQSVVMTRWAWVEALAS